MTSKEKYELALDKICNRMLCDGECSVGEGKCELLETIGEAIIKAVKYDELMKPKKPIRFKSSVYISNPKCPICKTIPHTCNQKYCDECGQALDWSDEDE